MSSVVVLYQGFFLIEAFKTPTKVDADATDADIYLNDNDKEPGGINKDSDVTDDQ